MRFPVNETMNERIKVCTGRSVREKKKKNRNGYQSYYFSRRYISRKKLLIGNVIAILREFSCKKKFFFSLLFLFSFSFFFRRFIELETTTNTITTITTTTITITTTTITTTITTTTFLFYENFSVLRFDHG